MTDESIRDESTELDDIIAEYIVAEEAGDAVGRDELLKQHPNLSDDLKQFFADRDQFKRLASPLSPEASRRNDLPARIRYFGDYELLEEIAQGGMGVVYKARQTKLNRIVAVKMVLAGHLASEDDIRRFADEAETAANLKHKGIVPIHEVGHQNGQHYFSMDFIEGKNLAEVIRTVPPSLREAASIVKHIADAVAYAHAQGTVHRDIKPSNILLDNSGQPLITDFGLAMRVEGESELTRTGQILGTPAYMSPEQASGKRELVGPASDIYSLGAILYELLTGRPPLRGETAVETIQQVIESEPVAPSRLNAETPRDLETICLKCLQKEAGNRYRSGELLSDDLGRFLADEPILARPVGHLERSLRWCRRNPIVAAMTVAIAVLLVAGTTVSTYFAIEANSRAAAEREARHERDKALGDLGDALTEISNLNAVLKVNPNDYPNLIMRGSMYARLGMWEPASADFVKAVKLGPTRPDTYSRAAILLLQVGDIEGEQRICRIMQSRFAETTASNAAGNTELAYAANKLAMTCLRSPSANSMLSEATNTADNALTLAEGLDGHLVWAQLANGLAELRDGNPEQAMDWSSKCIRAGTARGVWHRTAQAHLVIAMAHWKLDQHETARTELTKAKTLLDRHQPDFQDGGRTPWEWLACQPLRREAEQLLRSESHGETHGDSEDDTLD